MSKTESSVTTLLPATAPMRKRRWRVGGMLLLASLFAPRHSAHAAPSGADVTIGSETTQHTPWAASVRAALAARAHRVALASRNALAWSQHGVASWYGKSLIGHRTSSGSRLDNHSLTAAHPTLPLGSKVLVENEDTGQSVIVTVNDRGPYNHRIIDLSHAAAAELGMLSSGTAHVKLAPLPASAESDMTTEVAQADDADTSDQAIEEAAAPVQKRHHRHR